MFICNRMYETFSFLIIHRIHIIRRTQVQLRLRLRALQETGWSLVKCKLSKLSHTYLGKLETTSILVRETSS